MNTLFRRIINLAGFTDKNSPLTEEYFPAYADYFCTMYQKDEFLSRIREQIASEEKYSAILDEAPKKLARSRKFLLIPLTLYLIAALLSLLRDHTLENVLVLWICSVFILYMVNFFIMMIPSFGSDADIKIIDKPILELIRDFLRLANLLKTVNKNKITIVEFFWNAFIINTKAVARGFSLLFISNIFCAAILLLMGTMHWTTFLVLCGQTVVIVMMYWKIVKAVPGTPGFFTKYGIPEERMGIAKGVHVWLSIGIFSVLTIIIVIGAMMLPGMTLGDYLADVTMMPIEYPIMLAATLILLGLWMRYMNGVDSVKVMRKMNTTHLTVLKTDLLPAAEKASGEELSAVKRRFILLSMNKLIVQEFFLRFPIYMLMPNIVIVADKGAQEILNKGEDKKLTELL